MKSPKWLCSACKFIAPDTISTNADPIQSFLIAVNHAQGMKHTLLPMKTIERPGGV